jgi:hypothetical protein
MFLSDPHPYEEREVIERHKDMFETLVREEISVAYGLFAERGEALDGGQGFYHKMPFGMYSWATELYQDASRVVEYVRDEALPEMYEDKLRDMIVHAAGALAFIRLCQISRQGPEEVS